MIKSFRDKGTGDIFDRKAPEIRVKSVRSKSGEWHNENSINSMASFPWHR